MYYSVNLQPAGTLVSTEENEKPELYQWLCRLKGIEGEEYRKYFISRENEEAVGASFLSHKRTEISDSGRGPDPYPGKRRVEFCKGRVYYRQRSGGAVPDGCNCRKEDSRTEVPFSHGNLL